MFNKAFKKEILTRLIAIEERLASDRRAVPVLKDVVNMLKKENRDLKDRLMARSFEEYKVYSLEPGPATAFKPQVPEVLDDNFAGEVVDLEGFNQKNEMVEP